MIVEVIEGRFRVQCAYGVLRFFAGAEVAPSPTAQDSPVILENTASSHNCDDFQIRSWQAWLMILKNFHCQIIQKKHSCDSGKQFGHVSLVKAMHTSALQRMKVALAWCLTATAWPFCKHKGRGGNTSSAHVRFSRSSSAMYVNDIHCNVVWNCRCMLTLSMVMPENLVM